MNALNLQLLNVAFRALEYDGNHVENHCPECGEYASECICAELDAARAAEQLADYACYACGAEATHEIDHRGGTLYVCDDPACVGEEPHGANRWQDRDADDAGVRAYGEI